MLLFLENHAKKFFVSREETITDDFVYMNVFEDFGRESFVFQLFMNIDKGLIQRFDSIDIERDSNTLLGLNNCGI